MKHATVAVFVPHLGCPHRCSFCDQRAITGRQRAPAPADVRAAAEAGLRTLGPSAANAELAFFGGSFTAIPATYRRILLEAAWPYVKSGAYRGIRLSTRPDAIDQTILDELRAFGVTTVELGAQSMADRVLQQNGRGHTAAQVIKAAGLVREAGFSLGLQMMTGLPGSTPESDRATARAFAALSPAEVRIYPALVLRGTDLAAWWASGQYVPQTLEDAVALCADLLDYFEAHDIRVIRLGLHASPQLEAGYLAGPWHPAFGELCRARQYRTRVQEALLTCGLSGGPQQVQIAPADQSKALGQRRCNVRAFAAQGFALSFLPQPDLPRGCFQLEDASGQLRRFRVTPTIP